MGIVARLKGEEPGFFDRLEHASRGKGHYGEYLTTYALEHGKLGDVFVLSNVIVPRSFDPSPTCEIDAVMLHEKGVFVFESKNYSGWIFGSADQRNWTATFNACEKEHFYNPVRQNRAHVKALSSYLGLDEGAFRSYIVFSERCELKDVPPNTPEYVICQRHRLLKVLRSHLERLDPVFDAEELGKLKVSMAVLAEGATESARSRHVEYAQRYASGDVCPWCGSELVRRNGKYGPFMGCSAYPRCRFTRNV